MTGDKHTKKTIVITEDEPTIRELLGNLIEMIGYDPILAEDAEVTLAGVKGKQVDLAIIDYCLPTQDGLWLAKNLNRLYPGLPVIIISGLPLEKSYMQSQHPGIIDVIGKPFELETIIKRVKEGLAAREELSGAQGS